MEYEVNQKIWRLRQLSEDTNPVCNLNENKFDFFKSQIFNFQFNCVAIKLKLNIFSIRNKFYLHKTQLSNPQIRKIATVPDLSMQKSRRNSCIGPDGGERA